MSTFDTEIPAPPRRSYRIRLTAKLKEMKKGQSKAVDDETARCLAAFIRRNDGIPITRKEGKLFRVWWS